MLGDKILESVPYPASKYLLFVNEGARHLDEEYNISFHSTMDKFSCITKISSPDIEPTVTFLCTCVENSDIDY